MPDGDLFPSSGSAAAPHHSASKSATGSGTDISKGTPISNVPTDPTASVPVNLAPAATLAVRASTSALPTAVANGYASSPSAAAPSPRPSSQSVATVTAAAADAAAAAAAAAETAATTTNNLPAQPDPLSPKKPSFRLPPTRLELSLQAAHRRVEAADRKVSLASSDEDFQSAIANLKDAVETLETVASYSERCMSAIRMVPNLADYCTDVADAGGNSAAEADVNLDTTNNGDPVDAPEPAITQPITLDLPSTTAAPQRERKRQRVSRQNLRTRVAGTTSKHGPSQALSVATATAPSDAVLDPTAMKTG